MRIESSGKFRWAYSRAELWADGIVHGLGVVLTIAGTAMMVERFSTSASGPALWAASLYLATLALSIGASAAYNVWPVSDTKWLLRRLDHSAIFLLIVGTYTPFMVEIGAFGVLLAMWAIAALGIFLKLTRPGRYDRLAIVLYLALGWSGVAQYARLVAGLPDTVLELLVAGGVLYSLGVVFHVWEGLRFQNPIWHGFVLAAAAIHYAAVWQVLAA
ncbi:PAQR family membrane homeostasis protein TrhA [Aureimonas psammosilenae]|uniref:PAQR family membrane homeostasis protein TrhA n=1 Tax=Aureimonas psammosilenae TaxID=2495496 RepID=UPI001260FB14|nr:hemolysin III family protein [Aureimonas psammosilenae]